MTEMVKMLVDSVRVSLTSSQRIVVLRSAETAQYLPIWIGPFESEAITIALQEIELARPQTHDLIKNMLGQLNARVDHIEITGLREDVFSVPLESLITRGSFCNWIPALPTRLLSRSGIMRQFLSIQKF